MKKVFIFGCLMVVMALVISRADFSSEIEPDAESPSIETILVHSFSMLNNVPIGVGMGAYDQNDVDIYRQSVQKYLNLKDQSVSEEVLNQEEILLKGAYKNFVNSRKAVQLELDSYNKKLEEAIALLKREEAGTGVFFTPEAYYKLQAGLKGFRPYEEGQLVKLSFLLEAESTIESITRDYLEPKRIQIADEAIEVTESLFEQVIQIEKREEKVRHFRDGIEDLGKTYNGLETGGSVSKDMLNDIVTLANATIAASGQVLVDDSQIERFEEAVRVKPSLDTVQEAIHQVKSLEEEIENLASDHIGPGLDDVIIRTVTIEVPEDRTENSRQISLSNDVVNLLKDNKIDRVRLDLGQVSFELSGEFLNQKGDDNLDFSAKEEAPLSEGANIKNAQNTEALGLPVYDLSANQDGALDEAFDYPLALTFDLSDVESIGTNELFVVHRLNDATGLWEPVYGFYDPVLKRMVVRRGHLSKYTVLKSQKNLSQIEDSWAKEEIAALVTSGVIEETSLLDPKGSVSREEFSNWIVKAYGLEAETLKKGFDDISEDNPYYESVRIAYELGIVSGYEDGSFKPEADITKDELAMMIGSAIEAYNQTINTESFELSKYEEDLPEWAVDSIERVVENGLVTEDYFVIDGAVTMEEAASILYNINNIYR